VNFCQIEITVINGPKGSVHTLGVFSFAVIKKSTICIAVTGSTRARKISPTWQERVLGKLRIF
jgi:hypothetical protein